MSEDGKVLVDAYGENPRLFPSKLLFIEKSSGKGNNLDIGAETLEFDIAAVLGRTVSIPQIKKKNTTMSRRRKTHNRQK